MSGSGGELAAAVARRLGDVRRRIAAASVGAGRQADAVRILAVTKGFGPEAIAAALGGLPARKAHAAMLAASTLRRALDGYAGRTAGGYDAEA